MLVAFLVTKQNFLQCIIYTLLCNVACLTWFYLACKTFSFDSCFISHCFRSFLQVGGFVSHLPVLVGLVMRQHRDGWGISDKR